LNYEGPRACDAIRVDGDRLEGEDRLVADAQDQVEIVALFRRWPGHCGDPAIRRSEEREQK
jgi:hypothetical protein